MKNKEFEDVWFQSRIYKPQNFGKIIYIVADTNIQKEKAEYKIISINIEDWNGIELKSTKNSTFIEAIASDGDIVFIYNCINKLLVANNNHYYNVSINKIITCLKDCQHDFYKGDKKLQWEFENKKAEFIENLFLYEDKYWYIISVETETRTYPHGHNDPIDYYKCNRYKLYNGKQLIDITIDNNCHKNTIYTKIDCIIPDIDKKLQYFGIDLTL